MVARESADADEQSEDSTVPDGTCVIGERYLLSEQLGRGGYGVVWKARDRVLGRDVALKELFGTAEDLGAAGSEVEFAEVRALAAAECSAVVKVYDAFRWEDRAFIVMQLVNGRTLEQRLASGPMTPRDAASMGIELLDALETVHGNGVLHRDLKPANIMLEDGKALLTDFGIARLGPHGTERGCPTLGYLAPEAAKRGGTYTKASELWALGAVLQEAVTGKRAYRDFSVIDGDCLSGRYTPAERAGPLAEVIEGLLCHHPEERWTIEQARAGLGLALVRLVGDTPTDPAILEVSRRVSVQHEAAAGRLVLLQGAIRRGRAALAGVTALLVVLVAVLLISWPGASGTGEQVPTDLQRRSPSSSIKAALSIPPGFEERDVDGRWPEVRYVKGSFRIQLRRMPGVHGGAFDEADRTVRNHRTRGRPEYDGEEKKISDVKSQPLAVVEYHGKPGAVVDIRYTDKEGERWRLLEYFVVNGSADCYRLQVVIPLNDPQRTQGEAIFNTVRRSLELEGF
ncbi:serine/threonine-protein kinase [Streptomyces sp. NPDC057621]|uniref:serine/threonine-protein kinase n=1 Tax=Streptomyces sp. NPDC057621 TaxID=3346186 RepID=UPI0036AF6961